MPGDSKYERRLSRLRLLLLALAFGAAGIFYAVRYLASGGR